MPTIRVAPRFPVNRAIPFAFAVTVIATPATLRGQTDGPVAHPLGAVLATSSPTFSGGSRVVAPGGGQVFVSDMTQRIVQLLDPSLAIVRTVFDSAAGVSNRFVSLSFLASFRGDSALFYDNASKSFIVVDPDGGIGRVFSAPITPGQSPFYTALSGPPTSSTTFGLVYTSTAAGPPIPPRPLAGQPNIVRYYDDSLVVVRLNYATRTIDTAGTVASGIRTEQTVRSAGTIGFSTSVLLPFYDGVVVTTDGSIAIFRARNYRLEWIGIDGTHRSGPALSYSWQPVTENDRQRLVDSVNAIRQRKYDDVVAKRLADSLRTGAAPTHSTVRIGADGERIPIQLPVPLPSRQPFEKVERLPDYFPPIDRSGFLADGDNNVWIRPTAEQRMTGFAVWDVINRAGLVIDRVRIPDAKTIAGFGPGVVYLVGRGGLSSIEKVRVR